jgi:tetratricopeptide (TPR) repeat protein/tRNA A-37 threonylcarbamoyl transferase component Bud32
VNDSIVESQTILKRGAFIGRYVVLGRVGRGAMGEIYAAFDPELHRKLAIKLLRARRGDTGDSKSRLLREAQAIARVSHPNVVVVHDVGSIDDRVFIAMEFIEGSTLTYWLHAATRGWREVLRVFLAAGRGLQGAHEAGLVHRDFKPDNVMVGREGQVRVMDFGLVRHADVSFEEPELPAGPEPDKSLETTVDLAEQHGRKPRLPGAGKEARALDMKLTQTGAVMGTPAYMAPEQMQGQAADARSDQFSFCVALYEALYNERPFIAGSMPELAAAVRDGKVRPPPERTKVPVWVRRAVRRGLSADPAARFPSMAALVEALEHDPRTGRRHLLLGAVGVAALGAAAITVHVASVKHRGRCQVPAERLAGVWELPGTSTPRRSAVEAAFRQTGKDYAPTSFEGLARVLDRFVGDWTAMYTDACEATNVRGVQSAEVLDLRMTCLDDRLGELRALSDLLVAPTGDVVENAAQAAMALGPLERCADVKLLRSTLPPPTTKEAAAAIQAVRAELAAAKALEDAGQLPDASALLAGVADKARATGYRPIVAEALYQLGKVAAAGGDGRAAESFLTDAVSEAQASHHDELLVQAMTTLIYVRGCFQRDLQGADLWRRLTEASLERMGGNDRLRAAALSNWAAALDSARRFDDALSVLGEALTVAQRALGPSHFDVGLVLARTSSTLSKLGQFEEALAYNDRALAITEAALGPDHPRVGDVLANRAEIAAGLGRYDESRKDAERNYALWSQSFQDNNPFLAVPLAAIGIAELGLGHPQRAVPPLTRALALAEHGQVPVPLTDARFALARALWSTHRDRAGAVALARTALAEVTARDRPTARDDELREAIEEWQAQHAVTAGARVVGAEL